MNIEIIIACGTLGVVLLLIVHARLTIPEYPDLLETVEVGHVAAELPPPPRRDVLDDLAAELEFEALTAESSAEHRLALLDVLLNEADHETVRLEFLVSKLGNQLVPAA